MSLCRAPRSCSASTARVTLFRAGLRCRLSCAWPSIASCARCRTSHLRAPRCARFIATWRLSSAVRSSHAGHDLRGIAEHPKQYYRFAQRPGNLAAG
nr:hypothetical protein [bacterium]